MIAVGFALMLKVTSFSSVKTPISENSGYVSYLVRKEKSLQVCFIFLRFDFVTGSDELVKSMIVIQNNIVASMYGFSLLDIPYFL